MNTKKSIPVFVVILFLAAGSYWLLNDPVNDFQPSIPGMDNRGKSTLAADIINIGEHFNIFKSTGEKSGESWPRFRGSDFDNICKTDIDLIDDFTNGRAETKWSAKLGEGHAGAAIYNGLVYLLDYDEEKRADMLHCWDLESGEEVWRRWYEVPVKRNHGMSRTVPAVTDDYILTMGPRCHVMCLDRESGDFLWGIDLEREYETKTPLWYTGQCPLIDDGLAILAPGGTSLMIAVDCKTGEIEWSTPNPDGWDMSHSSIIPYTFNGEKMYVYAAVGGIIAVAAEGRNAGEVLWKTNDWDTNVIAPSPVCMPDGKIFMTAGYGAGSMMFQLHENDNNYTIETLYGYKPKDGLASEQQTPIYWEGHLFGIAPKDGGQYRNQFVCVNPDDTREILWSSGKELRFGLGPYIWADDKFYLLNDDGTLLIIEASVDGFNLLGSKTIIQDGHDAWAPLAIADGYMILRDAETLVCIDISEK
ncbi:MAG: PQQ-binding-like beta-propeller repeat protein [Prolixibacteraceae bacterium]|nr:PQQ-binding-like beta-propeller repeat protein [Prolixibacteraceae bacterium]